MRKYLTIFNHLIRYNIARETEFRGNFLFLTFTAALWVVFYVVVIEVYFRFTDQIVGWSKGEVFVLYGLFRIIKGIFDVFLRPNVNYLPEAIQFGTLDYLLTRPINPLFLLSVSRHKVSEVSSPLVGILILGYALSSYMIFLPSVAYIGLIIDIALGVIIFYCLILAFAVLAFFLTRLTAISSIYDVISNTLRFPADTLSRGSAVAELLVFPLALAVTWPAKLFLGKIELSYIGVYALLTFLLFALVYRFWLFALKRYTSASS